MNKPYVLAIITILFWGFGSFLSRLMSMKSEFILLSIAYVFTLITMLTYFLYEHKGNFLGLFKNLTIKDILFGPFGYFLYSVGLMQSFRAFNSASETAILNYTWPVFTVIFSETLFQTQAKKSRLFHLVEGMGIFCGLLAVMILATKGNITTLDFLNIKGVGWGLLSGISYGIFSAYSGTVTKERQGGFLLSSIITSLVLMMLFSIKEISLISTFTFQDLLIVFILGSLLNGVGYITWTTANRIAREEEINISSIASLMFILPILSLTIIAIFLKETELFEVYFLVSLIFVVTSSILCQKAQDIVDFLQARR